MSTRCPSTIPSIVRGAGRSSCGGRPESRALRPRVLGNGQYQQLRTLLSPPRITWVFEEWGSLLCPSALRASEHATSFVIPFVSVSLRRHGRSFDRSLQYRRGWRAPMTSHESLWRRQKCECLHRPRQMGEDRRRPLTERGVTSETRDTRPERY